MKVPDFHNKEYITIREAATILGRSPQRIYQYVREGRLSSQKFGQMFILSRKEVQQFKLAPRGRRRTKAAPWHSNQSQSTFVKIVIRVPIREGMREKILERVKALSPRKHTFRGTMARHIAVDNESMEIELIWKESELPNNTIRQQDIRSFEKDFPELEWETVQYSSKDVILLT